MQATTTIHIKGKDYTIAHGGLIAMGTLEQVHELIPGEIKKLLKKKGKNYEPTDKDVYNIVKAIAWQLEDEAK